MPNQRKRPPDEELDACEWSEGEVITESDKAKISLAVDRFFARRGKLGKNRKLRKLKRECKGRDE